MWHSMQLILLPMPDNVTWWGDQGVLQWIYQWSSLWSVRSLAISASHGCRGISMLWNNHNTSHICHQHADSLTTHVCHPIRAHLIHTHPLQSRGHLIHTWPLILNITGIQNPCTHRERECTGQVYSFATSFHLLSPCFQFQLIHPCITCRPPSFHTAPSHLI